MVSTEELVKYFEDDLNRIIFMLNDKKHIYTPIKYGRNAQTVGYKRSNRISGEECHYDKSVRAFNKQKEELIKLIDEIKNE